MRLSKAALAWALRFYRDHFWLIFGLSLIPAAQRFVLVMRGDEMPTVVNIATEVVAEGTRVVLVYLIIRLGILKDPELAGRAKWKLFTSAIDRDAARFFLQFVVVAAAFAVFDLLPNTLIAQVNPGARQDLVTAIVLVVKNPTVIALTFLWMIGVARVMMAGQVNTTAPAARST